jgi:polyphenol oxidase
MISPILAPEITTKHGFFTRKGGVSTGIYGSLNCGLGSNDDKPRVTENRSRVAQTMNAQLHSAYQIHSTKVAIIQTQDDPTNRPEADAMVTRDKDVALGILTADCAPILFHDPVSHVIGAAHAGWKGALDNIMESTISAMESLGAKRTNINATIGPCISQKAYETGPEFIERFLTDDQTYSRFFAQGNGDRLLFDLPGFVLNRLRQAGCANATWTGHCTFFDPENFFSFRRTTHAKEPDYGRQISVIAL